MDHDLLPADTVNIHAFTSSTLRPPIFYLYKGGSVPLHVTHLRIDKSIEDLADEIFSESSNIREVEMHDRVYRIGKLAFYNCRCLERISGATGVRVIDEGAFYRCTRLNDLEFGSKKLECIGLGAFSRCPSLRGLKIPSVRIVQGFAFQHCVNMTDLEFGEALERVEESAFLNCSSLRRLAMPLKRGIISNDTVFKGCRNMTNIELVGKVQNMISHFMQEWKDEMNNEIGQINQVLSTVPIDGKTAAVQQWIGRCLDRVEHFTNEHNKSLVESATILELFLWRSSLNGETNHDDGFAHEAQPKKRARRIDDVHSGRQERRMICGANIVVKNVLSFLQLK